MQPLPPEGELPEPLYIDSQEALERWVESLATADIIAVDTESDSFHSYREKVCLIQMTAGGTDVIIDPLASVDLEPLRAVFADARRTKIFHDAGYDLVCLHRDYGFVVDGLFDTMVASRLLGERAFGLAAILRERFGFHADKRLQRSDWARRPLTKAQLSYARFDTHFLPDLMSTLRSELAQMDRLAWAEEEFRRVPEVAVRSAERLAGIDGDRFWRIKGLKALSPRARERARALYDLRDRIAQRLDRPAFKVFGDKVLLDLAADPPHSVGDFAPRPGLRRGGVERFGRDILAALRNPAPLTETPPKRVGRRRPGRLLDPVARQRYEDLRELRRAHAEGLGIEPDVLLGNAALEDLARKPPRDLNDLGERPDFAGWRHGIFGEAVVDLLQRDGDSGSHATVQGAESREAG